MRESRIEEYLKQQMIALGGECFKFTSPGLKGVPDRICIFPGGKVVFTELKRPGEKPNRMQRAVQKRLKSLKANVDVVDSMEAADAFIARWWEE